MIISNRRLERKNEAVKYYNAAIELARNLKLADVEATVHAAMGDGIDISENPQKNLREAIGYFTEVYKLRNSVRPILTRSALTLLAMYIVMLYQQGKHLVSKDELILAYDLLKKEKDLCERENYSQAAAREVNNAYRSICDILGK